MNEIINYLQKEIAQGHYKSYVYCKKNYPSFYNKLINFKFGNKLDLLNIKDKVWCIKNNIFTYPKCKVCGKDLSHCRKSFCSSHCQVIYQHRSGCHTSPFKNKEIQQKAQNTKLKLYGTLAVNMKKAHETKLKNIDENGLNSYQRSNIKHAQTCLKRYGTTSYSKTKKHRELCSRILHTEFANKNREDSFYRKYNKKCYLSTNESKKYRNTTEIREILRQKSSTYQKSLTKEQKLEQGYKKINTRKKNNTLYSSKVERLWLSSIGIPNDSEHRQVQLYYKGRYHFNVDGFIKETNTVYEFLGDYYHGHPKTCPCDEKFKKTLERFEHMKLLGYNIVYCWESDFKKNKLFTRIFNKKLEY